MQNPDGLEFCSLAVNFFSLSDINFLSRCIMADRHVFFQKASIPGSLQSPSSPVLALHSKCSWVWDQQKCFKRYPLSIRNSFLAFQEKKNWYRALFQGKRVKKKQVQPFLQGAKMMLSLKKCTELVLSKVKLVNMWILGQCV